MQAAIGYGFGRSRIIAAKLAESCLLLTGVGIITGVLINIVPSVIGLGMDGSQHLNLTLTIAAEILRTAGYIAISAIAIFASQNAVNGIIFYVLFSTKSVYIILSMILGQDILVNMTGDLTRYLYTPQLYVARAAVIQHGTIGAAPIVAILVYVLLPTVISAVVFRKKELEF